MHFSHAKRTVLVPIFGADITADALATARGLLDHADTQLVLLHVVPSDDGDAQACSRGEVTDAEPRWHRLASAAPADRTFVEVVRGDPAQEVLDEAERFESDMIVLGPSASAVPADDWVERTIAHLARVAPHRVCLASRRNRTPRTKHRAAARRRRVFSPRRIHGA